MHDTRTVRKSRVDRMNAEKGCSVADCTRRLVATEGSSGSALPGILQAALSAWAESEQREIHPKRGASGPASQAAAREMLRRAQSEGR